MDTLKERILQTIENTLSDTNIEKGILVSNVKYIFKEFESKKVVLFKIGDKVKDEEFPLNGVVVDICRDKIYPVVVDFGAHGFYNYTRCGKYYLDDKEPSLIKIS